MSGFDDTAWHSSYDRSSVADEEEEASLARMRIGLGRRDRMRPSSAGAVMGLVGGAGALALVHLLETPWMNAQLLHAAEVRGVPLEASIGVAYVTVAACGAIIGAGFASVTRHLRRFVPLLVWSSVFFSSVALVVLAAMRSYGFDASTRFAPAVFAATALFAVLASFSLPLRRRSS